MVSLSNNVTSKSKMNYRYAQNFDIKIWCQMTKMKITEEIRPKDVYLNYFQWCIQYLDAIFRSDFLNTIYVIILSVKLRNLRCCWYIQSHHLQKADWSAKLKWKNGAILKPHVDTIILKTLQQSPKINWTSTTNSLIKTRHIWGIW